MHNVCYSIALESFGDRITNLRRMLQEQSTFFGTAYDFALVFIFFCDSGVKMKPSNEE